MKILELRFKNLNSLYGEWFIDFTDPEYTSNGIFSITGPTGAGKSTILDAICLALYGKTPRLRRINKSSNEIMSRGTGECSAEVMFESQAGRFRCHWGQHRARKKADGTLADARHDIVDAYTEKPIETKKSLVKAVIEEKTGMDFERFTRSILLAQGGFDTFLKAGAEEKSKILEQITGTEIYTKISQHVHIRTRNEREKLNILQAETSGFTILEPEQEKETGQDLKDKEKQETEIASKVSKIGKAIAWLTSIDGLKKEIFSLNEESEKLASALKLFKPDREHLRQALKAAELDGNYATLTAVRKEQVTDQTSLKAEEAKLPELEPLAGQKKLILKKAEQQTLKAKKDLMTAAPLIQKVRSLDQELADKKKAVASGDTDCKTDIKQIEADKKLLTEELKKRETAHKELAFTLERLETNSRDEWLVSGLAGIEEQFTNLLTVQKEITTKIKSEVTATKCLTTAATALENSTKQLNTRKQDVEEAKKHLEQGKNNLVSLLGNRLLREYRTEKETLLREMVFLADIAKLEDYRSKLEDGSSCPLCGSKEHPYAIGNIPEPDETEKKIENLSALIHKAEEEEAQIKNLGKTARDALKNLTDSEKLTATAANEKKAAEKILTDLREDVKNTTLRFNELKKSVLVKLQPLGIAGIFDSEVSSLLISLKERLKGWQNLVKKKDTIEKQISDLTSELQRLDAVINTRSKALTQKQTALQTTRERIESIHLERQELFGNKVPDNEESRLNKTVTDTELAEKLARTACDKVKQKLNSAKVHIASLNERIEKRIAELKDMESKFNSSLRPAGFADEKQFLNARLATSDRDILTTKAKELDDWQTELLAREKDRKNRLSTEIARKLTTSKLEELEPSHKELEENLKQLRNTIAALQHKLAENSAAKERIKEKQAAIEAQKKECHRWEKLHGLIGSGDGKKYRNFAQGLTFELMVSHANRQLKKMTDRYLLIRDDEQALALNVVDNYQAGEIRSTKNLSGGESFIVSLTLALGLSKMASRKVRVDSLFLDEGFGTLDEEALETALETLSGLQQDGKLIGIISHVSALKERISTQISIIPLSGGKSTITGPGCRLLNGNNQV